MSERRSGVTRSKAVLADVDEGATPGAVSEPVALVKRCAQCAEKRTLSTFAHSPDSEDGRVAVCRVCTG